MSKRGMQFTGHKHIILWCFLIFNSIIIRMLEHITFEQWQKRHKGILKRTDYYHFIINGKVGVKRDRLVGGYKYAGKEYHIDCDCLTTYGFKQPVDLEFFGKVLRLIEAFDDEEHLRTDPKCPCHEAKRLRISSLPKSSSI